MRFKVLIHHDGPGYWSEIAELPGCFASGRTLSELHDALSEAVGLYLWDEPAEVTPTELSEGAGEIDVRRVSSGP
jgi:predicted RNase H-like HicB family nuclease